MLRGKTILIVSPEAWGINKLSKHHYARSLAQRSNLVYFLQPSVPGHVEPTVTAVDGEKNLFLVTYTSAVFGLSKLPGFISDYFTRKDIRRIIRAVQRPFDVIWNFDMFRFPNVKLFRASLSILHPVDFSESPIQLRAAKYYDFVFSVSMEILEKFQTINQKAFFINHGISEDFILSRKPWQPLSPNRQLTCGYVGNLGIVHIHQPNLFEIISSNPDVKFHFIGPLNTSNLGTFEALNEIVSRLQSFSNVVLHGALPPERVATIIQDFDLFLICYNTTKAGKMASNNHKLLEYLSTGKTVVSSRISTYDHSANGMIEMVMTDAELPACFKYTIASLNHLNDEGHYNKRVSFTADNTYNRQLDRIEALITRNISARPVRQ